MVVGSETQRRKYLYPQCTLAVVTEWRLVRPHPCLSLPPFLPSRPPTDCLFPSFHVLRLSKVHLLVSSHQHLSFSLSQWKSRVLHDSKVAQAQHVVGGTNGKSPTRHVEEHHQPPLARAMPRSRWTFLLRRIEPRHRAAKLQERRDYAKYIMTSFARDRESMSTTHHPESVVVRKAVGTLQHSSYIYYTPLG